MDNKISVFLVEDESNFAYLISDEIFRDSRLCFLGHASCKASGVEMSCDLKPDIVVMDLYLDDSYKDGIEAAKEIRIKTDAKIIFLTGFENPDIMREANKKAFASGYVFKSQMNHIADLIYDAATKDTPHKLEIQESVRKELTPTEIFILDNIIEGNENVLDYSSLKTITNHKTKIFKKLGLKNKKEVLHVFGNW
ncbi:MAG: response regulator transcription factor [Clostridiales bacterium]|jgi:DNA-binding NarL/FixJ family response regulator|nr:response regulator transcription factor [Clostridiales bacterium]